jgi:hypothetical protein
VVFDWHVSFGQVLMPIVVVGGGLFTWFRYIKKVNTTLERFNFVLEDFPLHKHKAGWISYPDGSLERLIPKKERRALQNGN